MQLTNHEVKWLGQRHDSLEPKKLGKDWVPRCAAQQEAIKIILNLCNYTYIHNEREFTIFKKVREGNKETREYVYP